MSIIPYFYDMDRTVRQMERQFMRPEEFSPYSMVPREFVNQFLRPWDDVFKPMAHLASAMNRLALNAMQETPTSVTSNDNEQFHINVDVQHFAPEEICVKVEDGCVLVRGKHEEKRDGHGFVSREFVRRYALPEGCLPDTVQSSLSSDGVLTVTAPRALPLPSPGERIVPITHTGPIQKQISPSEDAVKEIENVEK